jgi:hypothetical protein
MTSVRPAAKSAAPGKLTAVMSPKRPGEQSLALHPERSSI